MSYLRGVLASKAAIRARPPGYVLDLGADGTDVELAERLLRQGTQSADPVQGARLLETALVVVPSPTSPAPFQPQLKTAGGPGCTVCAAAVAAVAGPVTAAAAPRRR
jgi:hypothetical protein